MYGPTNQHQQVSGSGSDHFGTGLKPSGNEFTKELSRHPNLITDPERDADQADYHFDGHDRHSAPGM